MKRRKGKKCPNMIVDNYAFDSISALGDFVANATPQRSAECSSQDMHNVEWYGGNVFSESVSMAQTGGNWIEGAKQMQPIDLSSMDIELDVLPRAALSHDLAGFMPDVPAFLNSEPECMYTVINEPSDNRLIKIGVVISRASRMDQRSIFNQGNAILSVVDELTTRGYSVELTAVYVMTGDYRRKDYQIRVDTVIKRADDIWSPESVAFALCHVGFSRHLGFMMNEQSPTAWQLTHDSYGLATNEDLIDKSMFDIWFGYLIDNGPYSSVESAIETVVGQVNDQITNGK